MSLPRLPAPGRRALLQGAGAVTALGTAGALGGRSMLTGLFGTGAPARDLTFWNFFAGGDSAQMQAMVRRFQSGHPDIDVQATTMAWGNPYYTKLSLATVGDLPPDIAVSHVSRVPTLAAAGQVEALDEGELAARGIRGSTMSPTGWNAARAGGRLWGVPLDTHMLVLYYRTDVCEKAGLLDSGGQLRALHGPEAFVDALKAAADVTGGPGGVMHINGSPSMCFYFFSALYYQLDGRYVTDQGTRVVLDHDKAEQALTFMRELTARKLLPARNDANGSLRHFSGGTAGFFINGSWDVKLFQGLGTPFSIADMPCIWGKEFRTFGDCHTFVLPTSPDRTPQRRKVCLDFIQSCLEDSYLWAEGGHIPAFAPVRTGRRFARLEPQRFYTASGDRAVINPPGWYTGTGSQFETMLGFQAMAALNGDKSPTQAARAMRSGLEKFARTPSPIPAGLPGARP